MSHILRTCSDPLSMLGYIFTRAPCMGEYLLIWWIKRTMTMKHDNDLDWKYFAYNDINKVQHSPNIYTQKLYILLFSPHINLKTLNLICLMPFIFVVSILNKISCFLYNKSQFIITFWFKKKNYGGHFEKCWF